MPKLLLADDSPTTQKVVQLTFADEGIDVVVADDGDTALELYEHHHPDIVLADINIPGLNGYEVCEAIRNRQDNGSTPVILLAGSFEPFDVEQAHRVGANDYLTKPFASIRRLVATVTALLDTVVRHDTAAEETIEPNSVPPDAEETEQKAVSSAQPPPPANQPGPVLPPEPDMYATDDIEHLINQSFVETVEMPHTVAERMMNEISRDHSAPSQEAPNSYRDDSAFDDELIETTFSNEPPTSEPAVENHQTNIHTVTSSEEHEIASSNGYIETSAPDQQIESRGEQFEPPLAESDAFESEKDQAPSHRIDTFNVSQAPTEEFQIDQSNDETYFEPTAEISEQPSEVINESEQGSDAVSIPEVQEQTGFEIVSRQEPASEEIPAETTLEPQRTEQDSFAGDCSETESTQNELEPVQENLLPSTPWDSVAEPQPPRYQLDESNLLELPLGFGSRIAEPINENENEISKATAGLAPAIVDEIARVTASQISEELVREIVSRIVPKVVEEVMARQRDENNEH